MEQTSDDGLIARWWMDRRLLSAVTTLAGGAYGAFFIGWQLLVASADVPLGGAPQLGTTLLAVGGLVLIAAFLVAHRDGMATHREWILVSLAVAAIAVGELVEQRAIAVGGPYSDDLFDVIPWLLAAGALLLSLRASHPPRLVRAWAAAAMVAQAIDLVLLAGGTVVAVPGLSPHLVSQAADMAELLATIAYVATALFVLVRPLMPSEASLEAVRGLSWQVRAWQTFRSTPGRRLAILRERLGFARWRRRHPAGTFADYYAAAVTTKLARGKAHRTLGSRYWDKGYFLYGDRAWSSASFRERGRSRYQLIRDAGLQPHHLCVDYGCGSLRIGQHLIRYLDPGRYWGLDVTPAFYQQGLRMLGAAVVAERRPRLHVIDDAVLDTLGRAHPDFVVSFSVIMHVPPAELATFFDRVMRLVGPRATALFLFQAADALLRTDGKSWAYPAEIIETAVLDRRPGLHVRRAEVGRPRRFGGHQLRKVLLRFDGPEVTGRS